VKAYRSFIPPCGIFCGACSVFVRHQKPCLGAATRCQQRKCRTFYVCCVEEHGLRFCHQCPTYPCSKFKKFAKNWLKYGQDMLENQRRLAELGDEGWLNYWNTGGWTGE
jgi:hypothetical protein